MLGLRQLCLLRNQTRASLQLPVSPFKAAVASSLCDSVVHQLGESCMLQQWLDAIGNDI